MTQITKTLSIAGIIALVTAPAMADIASTDYVQSIVNNVIPKTGTAGHVLKKTASGVEWAAAPSVPENVLVNNTPNEGIAIGSGANILSGGIAIGGGGTSALNNSIAIGDGVEANYNAIAIGPYVSAENGVAIKGTATGGDVTEGGAGAVAIDGVATGGGAVAILGYAEGDGAIQLGGGFNAVPHSLNVGLGEKDNFDSLVSYPLLVSGGTVPAGRLTGASITWNDDDGHFDVIDNNGIEGQLLQTNGDGTMSWVNAPAPSLESILPTADNKCKASDGQQCALVMTWSSSQNKFTYSWEVVKVSQ